jgi:hypothetical protein
MPAIALTAIPPLEVVIFCKNHESLFVEVKIFGGLMPLLRHFVRSRLWIFIFLFCHFSTFKK